MDNSPFISHDIEDKSIVGFVKREIHDAAVKASFSVSRVGVIDIAVSELMSNIIKHASGGELLYRFSKEREFGLLEVICLDNGPGIKDINHSMKDGVTTTNTLGQGLGALKRLCDSFHIYSIVAWGTICYCKIYTSAHSKNVSAGDMKVRTLNVSKRGQTVSGDGLEIMPGADLTKIFMGDGLGHGKQAHDASQLAIANFKLCRENDPVKILRHIHDPAKASRGLVATVVTADNRLKKWTICGIGNISTRLYDDGVTKNYLSYNGVLGLKIPTTLKNYEVDLRKLQCLVMSTDGLSTRWTLSQFPGILRHDPLMLAAAIYKTSNRKNDDSSILVATT